MTNPLVLSRTASLRRQAERGHVAAQLVFGQALLDSADPVQAARWFAIADTAGFAPAANMLGRCHEKGWGVPADPRQAASCYRRAAAAGDPWGCYNLANLYLRGRGVERDRLESWRLFLQAAGQGHAKSMNLVARFLDEGWDRARDRRAALLWYRRAAEAGDYRGQHNLATALAEQGALDEALSWWGRALPAATPDVREAMEQALRGIDHNEARRLLAALCGERASRGPGERGETGARPRGGPLRRLLTPIVDRAKSLLNPYYRGAGGREPAAANASAQEIRRLQKEIERLNRLLAGAIPDPQSRG